jgi:hypothetical protein
VLGFIASEFILVIFGFEADMAGFMFERAWFSLRITLNTPFLYKQRKSCNLQQLQWRVTMFGDPHPAKMTIKFLLVHWANWPEPQLWRVRKFATGGPQMQELVKLWNLDALFW